MIKRRSPPNKKFKESTKEREINVLKNMEKAAVTQQLPNQTIAATSQLSSLLMSEKNFITKSIMIQNVDDCTKNLGSIPVDSTNFKKNANASQKSMKTVVVSQVNTCSSNPKIYNPHQPNINELMLYNKYKILPHIIIKESKHGNLTIPVLPSFLTDRC